MTLHSGWKWAFFLTVTASTVAHGQDPDVQVTRDECARLLAHQARNDVNYQPGVDVHGRKVAPADLNAPQTVLGDMISIDLTVDLFERFGIPVDPALFQGDARIGTISVQGNRVLLNDKPIGQAESDGLATICREQFPQ